MSFSEYRGFGGISGSKTSGVRPVLVGGGEVESGRSVEVDTSWWEITRLAEWSDDRRQLRSRYQSLGPKSTATGTS